MDEYSELLIVNRPVIYISVSELLNTHKLLGHQEVFSPDSADPLRLLLKDPDWGSHLCRNSSVFKQLVIDAIRTQPGDSSEDILRTSLLT
ncbi:ras GTPase-activating-like protein IQGAP3 [Lates japonicus]|uniref:Ras GTPase-activating-like protein IQGAP3 n=1 Tax=Lates japonicus TaxID=270547 RepID=A0AAD3N9I7_LATJO|nr:ras GTPase-activating-like protein IQGAP3 [Lates japonicus]